MTNLRRPGAMSSQPFRQVCQFLRPATGANGRQRGRARADTAGDRNTLFCRVRARVRLLLPRPRRPAERHDRIQSRRHSEALPSTSDGSPKFAPAPSPRPVSDISRRKPSHVRLDNTRAPPSFRSPSRTLRPHLDDARLDTLFLAMSAAWRGTPAQYVGRLHRLHPVKREVLVYDYAHEAVPTLRRMTHKRIRGYLSMAEQKGTTVAV